VIGQEEQPSIVLESQKDIAGIVIHDKDDHPRLRLSYVPKNKVTGIVIEDANGDATFGAKFMEEGLNEKPVTLLTLNQPGDKGSLMLSAAPENRTGIVVQDQEGHNRSRLDRNGAATVE
jgi:hypothetical protein